MPTKGRRNSRYWAYPFRYPCPAPNMPSSQWHKIDCKHERWRQNLPERRISRPHYCCKCRPWCLQGVFHNPLLRIIEHTVIPYLVTTILAQKRGDQPSATNISSMHPQLHHAHVHDAHPESSVHPWKDAWLRITKRQDDHKSRQHTAPPKLTSHLTWQDAKCDSGSFGRVDMGREWTDSVKEKGRRWKNSRKRINADNQRQEAIKRKSSREDNWNSKFQVTTHLHIPKWIKYLRHTTRFTTDYAYHCTIVTTNQTKDWTPTRLFVIQNDVRVLFHIRCNWNACTIRLE